MDLGIYWEFLEVDRFISVVEETLAGLGAVATERNVYVVRTVWEAVTAMAWIPITMFLACGLSWLPIKIPPHNSPSTYFLPNLVQMWFVQEAICDFPCCNGYFYSTKKGRSVPKPPQIPSNSFRKSVIHKNVLSSHLLHTLRFKCSQILSCPIFLCSITDTHTHQSTGSAMTKRDGEIPSGWHLTPCSNPVVYEECDDGKRRAE